MIITGRAMHIISNTPLVALEERIRGYTQKEQAEIAKELSALAVHVVRLAAYVNARERGQTHEAGVKALNSAGTKARRIQGYTIAKDDLRF